MPEEQNCLQKVAGDGGAAMSEKGQPLPYPLDACAGCLDLTEQLAIRKSSNNLVSYDRDLLQGKKMEPPV
jgi:hypothetical protein